MEHYDYEDMPHMPRAGIRGENNKIITQSLFLEQCQWELTHNAQYTLGEEEVYHNGKWLPSAMLIYIHAPSEYEGMRRIVGSVKQWEALKRLAWFNEHFKVWQYEQLEIQKAKVRRTLEDALKSESENTAISAAKSLLAALTPKEPTQPKGRPPKAADTFEDEFEKDVARMGNVVPMKKG